MADKQYQVNVYGKRGVEGSAGNPLEYVPIKIYDMGDGTFSEAAQAPPSNFLNISTGATTIIKSGAGILRSIIINKPVSLGVITIYDNVVGSGAKIGTITNPLTLLQQQVSIYYNLRFLTGLTVVTSLADDLTVCYL